MLKTIGMRLLVSNLVPISENSIINMIGCSSKINRAKVGVKTAKFKSKNLVKLFLVKSILFVKNSRLSFFIPRA